MQVRNLFDAEPFSPKPVEVDKQLMKEAVIERSGKMPPGMGHPLTQRLLHLRYVALDRVLVEDRQGLLRQVAGPRLGVSLRTSDRSSSISDSSFFLPPWNYRLDSITDVRSMPILPRYVAGPFPLFRQSNTFWGPWGLLEKMRQKKSFSLDPG